MKKITFLPLYLLAFLAAAQSPVKSIPFEQFGDHIIIKVKIDNSESLDFIFDSGSGITVLDEDIADKLELVKHKVILNEGTVVGSIIKHNTIEIDGYLIEKNINVYSTDLDHLERSLGRDFDGIVGFDIMKHHAVRIDYDNKLFEVYNHGEHPKKGDPIPFKLNTSIPYVDGNVVLNNNEPHPATFFVMTGAGTTMDFNSPYALYYDVVHKTGNNFSYMVKSISEQETLHHEGHVKSFTFGKQKFEQVPIGISYATSGIQASHQVSGIIGNEILNKFNLEFDLPAKMIYLEKNSNYEKPFMINCSGLDVQLSKDKKKVLIHQVYENGPGELAGIKVDSELISVNGKAVLSEINLAEIKDLFKENGSSVDLVLMEAGTEKTISLTLESML